MLRTSAALLVLLTAQPALAGDFNPFLGMVSKEGSAQKTALSKSVSTKPQAGIPPLPALPSGLPPTANAYRQPNGVFAGAQGSVEQAKEAPKASFMISGRIGDQVALIDLSGGRSIVQDGTMKAGCFVRFPDVICDKGDMAQAKKEFTAEARAKAEEEETIATQRAKIKELANTVVMLREGLNASIKEVSEYKAAVAGNSSEYANLKMEAVRERAQAKGLSDDVAKLREELAGSLKEVARYKTTASDVGAELADLKTEVSNEKAAAHDLRKRLAEAQKENTLLASTKSDLMRVQAEVVGEHDTVTSLQKKLEAAVARGTKAELELSALRSLVSAPPAWVKGTAKEYKDSALGEVKVSRAGGQVFFCIASREEISADQLFGKSVIRKERKGDYTYYALNSNNVRVKE